jgi:hypothetical protein
MSKPGRGIAYNVDPAGACPQEAGEEISLRISRLRSIRNRVSGCFYCEYIALRSRSLRIDNFLRLIKALPAIGALAEAGIGRFRVSIAGQRGFPQISLTDGIADADVHGCANLSCEAFAGSNVCEPFLITTLFFAATPVLRATGGLCSQSYCGPEQRASGMLRLALFLQWKHRPVSQAPP